MENIARVCVRARMGPAETCVLNQAYLQEIPTSRESRECPP